LCAEQVVWENGPTSTEAGLVDCWGRIKLLDSPTVLGRNAEGISILEPSVSRVHAAIERTAPSTWQVSDRGSSNGTTVNGKRVNVAPLRSGDIVFCGEVGFLFLSPVPWNEAEEEVPQSHPTWTPTPVLDEPDEEEETFSGLRAAKLLLLEHSGGAGGVLEFGQSAVQLTLVQYELFKVLRDRMAEDRGRDDRVRGFVRSSELLARLPWDTSRADENHLKQLIRRVRRALARSAVPDLIEARHGFGYRLRIRVD
jgi:hypothetical protein